jgi:hypothetical protein
VRRDDGIEVVARSQQPAASRAANSREGGSSATPSLSSGCSTRRHASPNDTFPIITW